MQAIIVCIMGGLGNQMFQYAAGRALSIRLNFDLKLDISWYCTKGNNDVSREYLLDNFAIESIKASYSEIEEYKKQNLLRKIFRRFGFTKSSYVRELSYNYWPSFSLIKQPVYLLGQWQQEEYFNPVADVICQDFTFPPFSSPEARDLANKISLAPNSVCIHIRRGDYVENPATNRYHGVCSIDYYKISLGLLIEKIKAPPSLFLFSDDPAWVRKHFDSQGYDSTIVTIPDHNNKPYHDMHLMSLCKHHIIANSSFSWWGAWLRKNKGIVIAPKHWFAAQELQNASPVLRSWIRV
jgi:hypothetical protein